ncbi:unnamed protein product, partial [Symbiodinium natans]
AARDASGGEDQDGKAWMLSGLMWIFTSLGSSRGGIWQMYRCGVADQPVGAPLLFPEIRPKYLLRSSSRLFSPSRLVKAQAKETLMGEPSRSTRKRMYEEAYGNAGGSHACFDPEFADDGFCGGPVASVWAIFEQEIALAEKYGLHFDMGKTTLYLLSGEAFHADLRPFQALGIRIVKGIDIQMLQVPISGREDFYAEWNRLKIAAIDEAVTAIEQLPHKHVALHLLQKCMSFPKLSYCSRTISRSHLQPLLEAHSERIRVALQYLLGRQLTDRQWIQATLPTKAGGLGLTIDRIAVQGGFISRADIAMVCSCRSTREQVRGMLGIAGDMGIDPIEESATRSLRQLLPTSILGDGPNVLKQRDLNQAAIEKSGAYLLQALPAGEVARFQACRAPWADGWLNVVPSSCFDTLLSNVAVVDSISLRLGLEVLEKANMCPFCPQALDLLGHHCTTCMAGGMRTRMHYTLRDTIFRAAHQAGMRPKLEPGSLLPHDLERRPADILLMSTPLLRQNQWRRYSQLALDFALVSPFSLSSIGRGVAEIGAAARFYAEKKRQDRGTQEACQAQQIGFEPIVFETMGGCEFGAHQLLKSLCQECDKVLSRSDGSTKSFLKGRISIDIQRGLSHILERCRTAQLAEGDTEGHIRRFIHECSG